jgi:hypothetical protein
MRLARVRNISARVSCTVAIPCFRISLDRDPRIRGLIPRRSASDGEGVWSWHPSVGADAGEISFSGVVQTVGFGPEKSKMLYISRGID